MTDLCTLCEQEPTTTVWGFPVCQPCADMLGNLSREPKDMETERPELRELGEAVDQAAKQYLARTSVERSSVDRLSLTGSTWLIRVTPKVRVSFPDTVHRPGCYQLKKSSPVRQAPIRAEAAARLELWGCQTCLRSHTGSRNRLRLDNRDG